MHHSCAHEHRTEAKSVIRYLRRMEDEGLVTSAWETAGEDIQRAAQVLSADWRGHPRHPP